MSFGNELMFPTVDFQHVRNLIGRKDGRIQQGYCVKRFSVDCPLHQCHTCEYADQTHQALAGLLRGEGFEINVNIKQQQACTRATRLVSEDEVVTIIHSRADYTLERKPLT